MTRDKKSARRKSRASCTISLQGVHRTGYLYKVYIELEIHNEVCTHFEQDSPTYMVVHVA